MFFARAWGIVLSTSFSGFRFINVLFYTIYLKVAFLLVVVFVFVVF